jgi:hypothetical protein
LTHVLLTRQVKSAPAGASANASRAVSRNPTFTPLSTGVAVLVTVHHLQGRPRTARGLSTLLKVST